MQDLFLVQLLLNTINETFPNARYFTTPLGEYVELLDRKGFYIDDLDYSDLETKLVSFKLYGKKDNTLFINRVIKRKLTLLSDFVARKEYCGNDFNNLMEKIYE